MGITEGAFDIAATKGNVGLAIQVIISNPKSA
jgi:hypothetical protein